MKPLLFMKHGREKYFKFHVADGFICRTFRTEKSFFLRLMFDFTEVVGKNIPAAQTMENTYFYINKGGRKS